VATEIVLPTTLGTFLRLGTATMTIAMISATTTSPASTSHGQRADRLGPGGSGATVKGSR
jgi:hypothetical protein